MAQNFQPPSTAQNFRPPKTNRAMPSGVRKNVASENFQSMVSLSLPKNEISFRSDGRTCHNFRGVIPGEHGDQDQSEERGVADMPIWPNCTMMQNTV